MRARVRPAISVACAALAAALLGGGCGPDASLVGGACAEGLTQCDLRCVDLDSDPRNCGACGHACAAGVACAAGSCAVAVDALDATTGDDTARPDDATAVAAPDAGPVLDSGEAVDASDTAPDANGEADTAPDANGEADTAPDASPPPDADVDAACAPPFDTVDHCGDCATHCAAPNDTCAAVDGGHACAPLCAGPLTNCGGACVDTTSDPANCGACGKVCISHLCSAGACRGSTPGDVVVIGHDFATTPTNTAQGRVLANAVFIPGTEPLRVLSYERWADPIALAKVKAIVAARAKQLGRSVAYTTTSDDAAIARVLDPTSYDVFLVPDQQGAPAGALATVGAGWNTTTTAFTKGGGVAVLLDGDAGTGEMPSLVSSAGLLDVASHAALPAGSAVDVTAPSDVVGVGVLSPYGVWAHSATIDVSLGANITYVVRTSDAAASPVVVHRVVP